ncbi:MAG: glycerol-3-phosphate 1-O-acyltransferase PlsY [Alphaproteobacteria bacterium]
MDTQATLSVAQILSLPASMGDATAWALALLGGYAFGSIPFGLVLARMGGYGDIRKIGSGNIGATNVLRTGNKPLALATLLLDAGKGAIAVWLTLWILPLIFGDDLAPRIVTSAAGVAGFGAILGHCYPIWLKFKGGKGVATAMGMLLIAPWWPVGIGAGLTWLAAAALFRISSLAALISMAAAPLIALLLGHPFLVLLTSALAALIFWRHRENISRLTKGTEPRIGDKKKKTEQTDAPSEDSPENSP